jgi:serine/threonine protein kinase
MGGLNGSSRLEENFTKPIDFRTNFLAAVTLSTSVKHLKVENNPLELSEYVLGPLRKDDEFILYRGQHRNQVDAPSVLLLTPSLTRPAPESLKRMEHEYSLRAELDSSWAVRPLALFQLNGQTMLVLENPGGEPLDRLIQGPMEMRRFLRFAVGLATALSPLHKRSLIHKDIKPSNVLVNSATGEVWLMGFGIASRLPREHQWPEPPEFIAGTLPYMAPEQTGRMNRSIDSRSDLYAFGVTLYEMLTGRLPFTASDPMEWVQEAAYSLIPQDSRANAHLRIGRLIEAATPPDKLEERIFEIVNQLNRGVPLVTSDAERLQIAELNLIAGRRGRASTAYKSALVHLAAGEALLSEEHWETHHGLRFPLALHRAECEFLTGEFLADDERLSRLRLRAIGSTDLAPVAWSATYPATLCWC